MTTDATNHRDALLVIDMQVGLVPGAWREVETLAVIHALIAHTRAASTPVIFIQHEDTGWPLQPFHPDLAPNADDIVIRKRASDAFYETPLDDVLRTLSVSHLVVTGMQTEYCVDATSRRATSLGYDVTLVANGHTTGDSGLLRAAQIVAHHNDVLAHLAQPDHPIRVIPGSEITFAAQPTGSVGRPR